MAETFVVNSSQCTGPGSFTEAVSQANANPGSDVISINPDLIINATGCPSESLDPKDYFLSVVTDDLTIEGNNAQLKGSISWVTSSGNVTPLEFCPRSDPKTLVISQTPGFIKLAPGVDVVVEDLRLFELNTIANVQEQASLTLDNIDAERILTILSCTFTPAIRAGEGASVTIRDNTWNQVLNWGTTLAGVVSDPAIGGLNANSLIIENSRFVRGNSSGGFILWDGDTVDSRVLIVSSELSEVGGIIATGNARTHMVNSLWATNPLGEPSEAERIINQSSRPMTIEASTLLFNEGTCNTGCQIESGYGRILHFGPSAAPVELIDTAISANFPNGAFPGLLLESVQSQPPAFNANTTTWIQPIDGQDASALEAITNQSGLMTTGVGFVQPFVGFDSRVWATPVADGVLIDAIPQAACADINQLTNPIDLTCITEDVLGNPRVDGNDRRNIGAVQTSFAPHLALNGVSDGGVGLIWSRPHDPDSGAITGYEVCHGTGTPPDPVGIGTACPGSLLPFAGAETLTGEVTGLSNGTASWFLVRSVNPAPGPWSNLVSATPYGEIGTPSVTATSTSCGSALLNWTQPDLGGHQFVEYIITWREEASGVIIGAATIPDYDTLSTTISGLNCNTQYVFTVAVNTLAGGTGSQGTSTTVVPAEPIPVLDIVGLLLLAMLMLGIGMVGIRRFN